MVEEIDTVNDFKAHVKALLKDSKLQEAVRFVGTKTQATEF